MAEVLTRMASAIQCACGAPGTNVTQYAAAVGTNLRLPDNMSACCSRKRQHWLWHTMLEPAKALERIAPNHQFGEDDDGSVEFSERF
jgi:hypothetical protein